MYINVFECFSGMGAQHKAITKISESNYFKDINIRSVGISEWFITAIIANSRIHHGPDNTFDNYDNLDKELMLNYISKFTLSLDSKKPYPFSKIEKWKYEEIRELYIALIRTKNYGSILDIKGKDLPVIDFLTYSFPCQSISLAGKQDGIKVGTTSGLLFEIKRILLELNDLNRLPSFLQMENVSNILSKTHKPIWNDFALFLESLGYKNTTIKLNSLQVGIPQHRERVFCISELNGSEEFSFNIKYKYTNLHHFLDLNNSNYIDEYKEVIANNTKGRIDYMFKNKILNFETKCMTITTCQDRRDNAGLFLCDQNGFLTEDISYWNENDKKLFYRFLTKREQLLLMGFSNEDYEAIKDFSKSKIETLSGNSIVVDKLVVIFRQIFFRIKKQAIVFEFKKSDKTYKFRISQNHYKNKLISLCA